MTLRRALLVAVMSVASVAAQDAGTRAPELSILPIAPRIDELKQHLSLTDAQVTQLQNIQKSKSDAAQAVWEQMRPKEQELARLLEAGSNDVTRIGTLTVELNNLRRQLMNSSNDGYRAQALAVLTADQKAKLAVLDNALRLQAPAHQAISLNLLDYPNLGGRGGIMPAFLAKPEEISSSAVTP